MDILLIDYSSDVMSFIKSHHYLKSCPMTCVACVGLYELEELKGICLFAEPIRAFAAKKYVNKLELVRLVVLDDMEKNTESMFLSAALDLVESNFSYDGVITYADSTEGHQGIVYKACNFIEVGITRNSYHYIDKNGNRVDNIQVWRRAKNNSVHEAVQAYIEELSKEVELSKTVFLFLFKRNIPLNHQSTHSSWYQMKQRCLNVKYKNYDNYGGRGIIIDPRWISFDNFIEDMGLRPSAIHTLDRIDNNGNYCKENCRWANYSEQMRNTSRNVIIEFNGEKKCLMDWSISSKIGYQTLRQRVEKGITPPELFVVSQKQHLFETVNNKCKLCDKDVYNLKHQLCKQHSKRLERENCATKNGKEVPEIRDGSYKKLKQEVLNLEHKIRFESNKSKDNDYGIYFSNSHKKWVVFVYLLGQVAKKVSFVQFLTKEEAISFRESLKERYFEKYKE